MRVLYLINYAGKAGTEKYVENLIGYLHPDRAECHLCYNVDGPLAEKMRERGIPCLQLEMKHPFDRVAAKKLAAYCRQNSIDVIHAQYPRENYIAILAKKYCPSLKVIFTSHLTIYQNAVWKFFNRRMMKKDECVISVCEEGRDILISNGVPADKIKVIFNGIEPGDPPPERSPGRKRPAFGEDLPDGAVAALILARLAPEKGLSFLLDAVKKANTPDGAPIFLYVAGDGEERASLEAGIAQRGLTDRVRLLGYRTDTAALMRDADLYLNSSSSNEAMSFAMLEALAAGLPLIATRVGGSPDLVKMGGDCGYVVEYGDADGFASALRKLANDPDLRREYSAAARRKAENEFKLAGLLDDVYRTYQ